MEVYPTVDGFKGLGFQKLTKDIQRSSFYSGLNITKNVKYPVRRHGLLDCQRFSCCKCLQYRSGYQKGKKSNILLSNERNITYHQNRLNTRRKFGKKC